MKIYAIDRDFYALKQYEAALNNQKHQLQCFTTVFQLKEAIETEPPDVAIVESELHNLEELVGHIHRASTATKIILAGNGSALPLSQLNLRPDGFLEKPVTQQSINKILFHFAHPLLGRWM